MKSKGGRPPTPLDTILEALLFRLREGCSWRALSIFAPHTTIYTYWKRWCEQGLWDRILQTLAEGAHGQLWSIDSTSVKVHKHARGGPGGPEKQEIGNSRGGANTKIHALVDGKGRALRLILTEGQRNDIVAAPDLVTGWTERRILADKAYETDLFRELLEDLGLKSCIPPKANRNDPAAYHKGYYKHRHHVENFFGRIKEKRAIATRYEKLASRFMGFVSLASIYDWLC